jgi:Do/DeqQ family serine protease
MKQVAAAALLILASFLAGLVVSGRVPTTPAAPAEQSGPAPQKPPAPAPVPITSPAPVGALPDFASVAARTVGAITNISSLQIVRAPSSPFANDPFFRYFFGDEADLFGRQDRRQASLGSGVVVSSDGYVLTNNHVLGGETQDVVVSFADKREMHAKIVGIDPWTDLALVKVDANNLPVVPWGDSSRLRVADWVLAIGNPFQLNQTVTLGIISAVGRANVGIAAYEDFIQTDAAINPGNSGGGLINARGELVGINTAIYSQSGGYQGIGFAVPSNLARRVMNDLIQFGEVRRGSIGYIEVAPVTSREAEQLGVPAPRGALVSRMARNSAAFDAGIRPGDVIVSFGGQAVQDPSHFLRLLADAKIGSTVRLELVRDGQTLDVQVVVSRAQRRRTRTGI